MYRRYRDNRQRRRRNTERRPRSILKRPSVQIAILIIVALIIYLILQSGGGGNSLLDGISAERILIHNPTQALILDVWPAL
jgi:hypothetical protein